MVAGDIKTGVTLIIGKNAKVLSNIKTIDAEISGYFKGDIQAFGQVKITPTGKFTGDLLQDKTILTIEKGWVFKGKRVKNKEKIKKWFSLFIKG